MLNRREWNSFVGAAFRKPWRIPGHTLELAGLATRRVANSLRLRASSDPHQGLRQRPEWLPQTQLMAPAEGPFHWPDYPAEFLIPVLETIPALPMDDGEAYLQRQRWSECVIGAIAGGAAAEQALAIAQRWMQSPKPTSDPAWEPYSASERVANVAVLLSASPALREKIDTRLLRDFLLSSSQWIDKHLEYYGEERSNNHFLNNARALIIAGSVLNAPEVLARGLAIFRHFAPRLFSANGFLRERSSHYQLVVAGWLFDALHFARAAGAHTGELDALEQPVARACAALRAVIPDMDVHIGDISPDLPPPLSAQRLMRLYPQVFEHTDTLPSGDWRLLLLGQDALAACTPPAWPLSYTTHGHADLCSFVWRHAGRIVLADPGRASYLQTSQTDARAHNTVLLNGMAPLAESVLSAGLWFPHCYAEAKISVQDTAQGLVIEHDGFQRVKRNCLHCREISLNDGRLEVSDSLGGVGKAQITLLWHFAPAFGLKTPTSLSAGDCLIEIDCLSEQGAPAHISWEGYTFSAAYGDEQQASRFVAVFDVQLPCVLHSRFRVSACAA